MGVLLQGTRSMWHTLQEQKLSIFFSQSISSTTDTLPNYGPFVYIEIKIIALKKCLPTAQDTNIHHTP